MKRPQTRWYGWQIIATDSVAVVLIASSIALATSASDSDSSAAGPLAALGIATYALGGPIVHFAHGHTGKGFGSLALRVLGPPAAGAFGAVLCMGICASESGSFGDLRPLVGFVLGTFVGLIAAPIIDAAALAHEPLPTQRAGQRARNLTLSWVPEVALGRSNSVRMGLRAEF